MMMHERSTTPVIIYWTWKVGFFPMRVVMIFWCDMQWLEIWSFCIFVLQYSLSANDILPFILTLIYHQFANSSSTIIPISYHLSPSSSHVLMIMKYSIILYSRFLHIFPGNILNEPWNSLLVLTLIYHQFENPILMICHCYET